MKTEEDELTRIVDEIKLELGKSVDLNHSDIPWSQVSQRMGHTRSRQQCSAKWYDCISSITAGITRKHCQDGADPTSQEQRQNEVV
jgi:hypothetical protein